MYIDTPHESQYLLTFGASSASNSATTYLYPGGGGQTNPAGATEVFQVIRVPTGRTAKISKLTVTVGQGPATQGSVFTVQKRTPGAGGGGAGSASAVTCTLATSTTIASDDTNTVTVLDKDEISLKCVPTGGQTAGPARISAVALVTIT